MYEDNRWWFWKAYATQRQRDDALRRFRAKARHWKGKILYRAVDPPENICHAI